MSNKAKAEARRKAKRKAARVAAKMRLKSAPTQRSVTRVELIAERLGVKLRGSVKDYVVIVADRVFDDTRSIDIAKTLPQTAEAGTLVRYVAPGGDVSYGEVISDYGDNVKVKLQDKEIVTERNNLTLATKAIAKPRIVHKRELHRHIDEKLAGLFWDRKLGLRVPTKQRREPDEE